MSMDDEPVQTTWPWTVMSVSMASLFLSWIASTDAVTSIGGRVSSLPSSLQHTPLLSKTLRYRCTICTALTSRSCRSFSEVLSS